jgi:phage protein D
MSLLDLTTPAFRAPADCVIRVDNKEIVELYPFLREVTAECLRDEASTARLVFETQRDEHGRWTVQDSGLLAPWKRIVIEAAFGQHTEELFRGFIREIHADYPNESGAATVTVECQDASLALDRLHVRRVWGVDKQGVAAPTTDGEIVTELAKEHGLSFAVNPGSRPLPPTNPGPGLANLILYQNSTDIRFLRARADANGYELYFRAGAMYFGPMQIEADPRTGLISVQPTIRVYAGPDTNCLSLSVTTDGHLPDKVAFDLAPTEGTEITRQEIEPDLASLGTEPADARGDGLKDFTWLLSHEGSFDEDELTARARGRANDFALRVRAEGELDGTLYGHVLLPGLPVAVDGAGDWLGGVYYVDRVSHRFDLNGYRQQIRLLRNAYGDNLGAGPGVSRLAGIL